MDVLNKNTILIGIIAAHLAFCFTYLHHRIIIESTIVEKIEQHDVFMRNKAPNPYQWRLLLHWVTDGWLKATSGLIGKNTAFAAIQAAIIFSSTAILLGIFYIYLTYWFDKTTALCGMLWLGSILPFTLANYHYQPSSLAGAAFFIVGMWLIQQRKMAWFAVLLALSALNRIDTAMFLLLFFAVIERRYVLAGAYGLVIGAIALSLYQTIGWNPVVHSAWFHLLYNLQTKGSILAVVLFGPLWIFAYQGKFISGAFLRRSWLMVTPFVCIHLLASKINEVRLLVPLAAVLVPLAFNFINKEWRSHE